MFNRILPKKQKSVPQKEKRASSVPARRFNGMIDYYTSELKSRMTEIESLKRDNEMLIKTSLRNASRSDELRIQLSKLLEDNRVLQKKLERRAKQSFC